MCFGQANHQPVAQAELDALIERSTQQALTMSERALQGIQGLAVLEQAVNEAERRLEQEMTETRDRIAKALHLLDELDVKVGQHDDESHQVLADLDQQAALIERDVQTAAQTVRTESASLANRSDETAAHLQHKLVECRQATESLRALARSEVTRLQAESVLVATSLHAVRDQAEAVKSRLDKAVKHLIDEHGGLDRSIEAQLALLHSTYQESFSRTEHRLHDIEAQLKNRVEATHKQVDDSLVVHLATDLRRAADSFATDLSQIEKELDRIVDSLQGAHNTFQTNMSQSIQPGVINVASGLHNAAQHFGMFS